jgi:hypothetical protein
MLVSFCGLISTCLCPVYTRLLSLLWLLRGGWGSNLQLRDWDFSIHLDELIFILGILVFIWMSLISS